MNSNLSPLSHQTTLSQTEMLGKLAEQGVKVSVNHETKAGVIEANGRQFTVKIVDVNGEHPLDANAMTQVATRLAYMLFSKDLLSNEFQGAHVNEQGIQLKDGRTISHETENKEIFQDINNIVQGRLESPSQEKPVQSQEKPVQHTSQQSRQADAEFLSKKLGSAMGLDQTALNAISKYGVNQVMVNGKFSQEKFEALEKAGQQKIQAQQNPKTTVGTRLKSFLSGLTQTNKAETARVKPNKHTISHEDLSKKLGMMRSGTNQYAGDMVMLQKARDKLATLQSNQQKDSDEIKEAKIDIKNRIASLKNQLADLKTLHKELSRSNFSENEKLRDETSTSLADLTSLVKTSDPLAACSAHLKKNKLIPNEELSKKLNMASFEMKQYTKEMAMLQKTRDGFDKLTPDQQKGAKQAIENKEKAVQNHMANMKALYEELSGYNLEDNKKLKTEIDKHLPDLETLVNASDPHAASLAYIEKYKTVSDFQSGIVSGFTAAWSEKYPFRKPEEPSNLIIGHESLALRDPANADSYKELVSIFKELHSALETASKTFGPLTQGTVSGPIIKPEARTTQEVKDAQAALKNKMAELKQRAETLTFTTTEANKLPIPTAPTLGHFSVINLVATFSKISNDLAHFDNLNPQPSV